MNKQVLKCGHLLLKTSLCDGKNMVTATNCHSRNLRREKYRKHDLEIAERDESEEHQICIKQKRQCWLGINRHNYQIWTMYPKR